MKLNLKQINKITFKHTKIKLIKLKLKRNHKVKPEADDIAFLK